MRCLQKPEDALSLPRGYLYELVKMALTGSGYIPAPAFTQKNILEAAEIAIKDGKSLFQSQAHIVAYARNKKRKKSNPKTRFLFMASLNKRPRLHRI